MIITYKYRVKSLTGLLNKQAEAVNFVWNFCNDTQKHALKWHKKWPSKYDLQYLTAGSAKELGLYSQTVQEVCGRYAQSRSEKNRPYLRYRGKKCTGWIPLTGQSLKREGTAFRFAGNTFRVFNSRPLPDGKIKDGTNFSQDRKGNWYLNIVIEVQEAQPKELNTGIGIDLGLKEFATLSTGVVIPIQQVYRKAEDKLAVAQRANKKKQVKKIHAKVSNSRKDFLHKLSTDLVNSFDYIAVGNVSSSKLAKTTMAKSVLDAGWSSFRNMLKFKSVREGTWFEEVNESFTTQACSDCGSISGPKGQKGLEIRSWVCSECGSEHERDINAAINILNKSNFRIGHDTPVEGIPALKDGEDVKLKPVCKSQSLFSQEQLAGE
jgi:putative transposase